jgi:hypothetical protein
MTEALLAGSLANLLIVVVLFVSFRRSMTSDGVVTEPSATDPGPLEDRVRGVERAVEDLEERFQTLRRNVLEDKDAANKQWRKIRARERRQEELAEEDGGEVLPLFNADGGETEGVPALPAALDPAERARQARAQIGIARLSRHG